MILKGSLSIAFCMAKVSSEKLVSQAGLIYQHPSLTRHTAKTVEIDGLRFTDKDLDVVGTLDYGQFGVVCRFAY